MTSRSGMHSGSTERGIGGDPPVSSISSADGMNATSWPVTSSSGLGSADVAATSSTGVAADSSSGADAAAASSRAGPGERDFAQLRRRGIANAWNLFQHQNKGRGLTSSTLAQMYKEKKSGPNS
eukprot:s3762_g14.t1